MNKIALRVGLCLIGLGTVAALIVQNHRSNVDKAGSAQAAAMFFEALSNGALESARLHAWGDGLRATLNPPAFESFRDAQFMEILGARPTSSENRPDDYRDLYKMMSVEIRIKTVRPDDSGNPPGEYTMFVLTVQPEQADDWFVAEIGSGP